MTITATINDGGYADGCIIVFVDTTDTNVNSTGYVNNGINIYPNPAYDKLHFTFPDINKERQIGLYNTFGQFICEEDAADLNKSVELANITDNGLVVVQVITDSSISTFKVIVNSY